MWTLIIIAGLALTLTVLDIKYGSGDRRTGPR